MKFVMPFTGSRGDVQPGIALGIALADAGHHVQFGAPPNLVEFAAAATLASSGVTVSPFGPDTSALLQSDLVRVKIKSRNPRTRIAALAELANYGWDQMTSDLAELSSDADAVVTGTLGQEMAFNVAESRSIPFAALHYCPIRRNGTVPVAPGRTLPRPINDAAWRALESMRWRSMRTRENAQRSELGLAAATDPLPRRIADYGGVELQAYDATLFPGLRCEWNDHRPFVGFIELRSRRESGDIELYEWIESGSPPVYFGFGSMPVADPAALLEMITAVCGRLGLRALVASGWSSIAVVDNPNVKTVTSVDHARVFPLCAGVVHHGGAGTTAAGLRAGRPTMVCWFSADQPFWGAAVARAGAGCSTKFRLLTESVLEQGLRRTLSPRTTENAIELGANMITPERALADATNLVVHGIS